MISEWDDWCSSGYSCRGRAFSLSGAYSDKSRSKIIWNRGEEERSDSKSWVVMKICWSLEKLGVPAWFFMTVCVWHHSISPGRAVKISKDMLWGSNIWFNGNASRGRASCYIQGVFFKEQVNYLTRIDICQKERREVRAGKVVLTSSVVSLALVYNRRKSMDGYHTL